METRYERMSAEERAALMLMNAENSSPRAIARILHRSPSTISRELSRNRLPDGN